MWISRWYNCNDKYCSCLELKIFKKEKNDIYFVSTGNDGRVFYNILKTGLFCRMSTTQININNKTPIFMVKFITFSVENQKLYSNLKDLKKFVILGSLENIYLFNIETLKEVFVIKKPNYIRENVVPDASIGIGRAPKVVMRFAQKDEKDHLLLNHFCHKNVKTKIIKIFTVKYRNKNITFIYYK